MGTMRPTSVESGVLGAEQFELRIDHFDAAGAARVDFGFAVQDDALAGAEAIFEIAAVEKFAGQRAGGVLHEQVIDGAASAARSAARPPSATVPCIV